jgi:inner membrane protein
MGDWIGWVATAVFVSSYFCKQPAALRRVQGLAALMWVVYGALIHAVPVVAANVLVAGVAIWSSFARPATALPGHAAPTDPLASDGG